jgi:NADH pyrophosphatase NudC (nudix superfamily)
MTEYITKEEACKECFTIQTKEYGSIEVVPVDYIASIESADVQSVKHGQWVCEFYNDVFDVYQADCSVCKKESTDKYDKVSESYEYCPHCGARMDLKDGEAE